MAAVGAVERVARRATTAGVAPLLIALAFAAWTYRETFASIVATWNTNSTFSHGFLILPLSAWLGWRNRAALRGVCVRTSWVGAAAVVGCVAAWVVGRGAGVLGLEQAAAVALLPALVLAVCGGAVTRAMAMPLGFLVFAIPVGHAIVPLLMRATADVSAWALRLTQVPVYHSDLYLTIPAGSFEIARACSGLNYLITGLALGSLYSYLTYAGWRKRLLSMIAFVVVPVVANGLRVYFTVLVSHLTDMRFGPGDEHVWFGRVFFILVMLAMFWVGRRWADVVPPAAPPARGEPASTAKASWPVLATVLLATLIGPHYVASAAASVDRQFESGAAGVAFGHGPSGWAGPMAAARAWRPLYEGARAEQSARYLAPGHVPVDVYVGVYGLGATGGAEMIAFGNRIYAQERISLMRHDVRVVELPGGVVFRVRDAIVPRSGADLRVWYWYMVGSHVLTGPYAVKLHEGLAFLARRGVPERIVTVATPAGPGDQQRLEEFLASTARCARSGFPARVVECSR